MILTKPEIDFQYNASFVCFNLNNKKYILFNTDNKT